LTRALTNFNDFGNAVRAILNEIFTALVRLAIVRPFLATFFRHLRMAAVIRMRRLLPASEDWSS
ncbi:hypothetical protein LCGC14_3136390, partial [marine sediment metagenome]